MQFNTELCISIDGIFHWCSLFIPASGDFPKIFIGDPTDISQGHKKFYILEARRGIMGKADTNQGPNFQLSRRK